MLIKSAIALLKEVTQVYLVLLKVMVPAIVIVKILDLLGGTEILGRWLAPCMELVGLPEQMGIVWATAILTNIYMAMVVFVDVSVTLQLSVAQVSVIGILMLISHSVIIEGAVAKMVGVSWSITISLKLAGGLLLAGLVNWLYGALDYQQQPAVLLWQASAVEQSLAQWAVDQILLLISIYFIIMTLMLLLKLLRKMGIERLLHRVLNPVLSLLSISKNACNITIIGITLGLSFGAGLLISEVKKGHLSRQDVLLSICFLSLAHSLIEDTLLILMLGSDIGAILWLRLGFAIVVVAILAKVIELKKRRDSKASAKCYERR